MHQPETATQKPFSRRNLKLIVGGLVAVMALQGLLSAQAGVPGPGWLAKRMTIRVRDGRLSEVLAHIQRAGGFTLEIGAADKELLPERITMDVCGGRLEDILKTALGTARLTFKVVDEKTVQAFKPVTPPERITMKDCPVEDVLKPLLRKPPRPFDLLEEPVQVAKPTTP